MEDQSFSIRSRIRSFVFAIAGMRQFILREHNARIHLVATIAVTILTCWVKVSRGEAGALVVVIALVWITEMLNTCVERMADLVTKSVHPEIKFIKDLAAGAVLVAAIAAVITGCIIFIPKIL